MPDQPTGKTKHTELTLDQIAEMQPGLAGLMPEVGNRYWICYYAARGGNWALAAYQLRHLLNLLRQGGVTRPKHESKLSGYARDQMGPLMEAIKAKDRSAFEAAYRRAIEVANDLHRELGHPDIVWRLPPNPPEQFDLSPQPEVPPKPKRDS
jgi:hypothetical protein